MILKSTVPVVRQLTLFQTRISACIDVVARWMRSNRLQLNSAKTEILWLATSRRIHQLPRTPLCVSADFVVPSTVVRDLGILIDSDVSMQSHVTRTVSTCFAVLRQLRTIRRSVSRTVIQLLVTSLVLSRLDYGNATLAGIPQHLLWRLQSVMNATARLIHSSSRFDHITRPVQTSIGVIVIISRPSYSFVNRWRSVISGRCVTNMNR